MAFERQIQQAADLIRSSQRLTALTGAGVSAKSGIPTFRDALTGLWAQYDPTRLATRQAFERQSEAGLGFLRVPPRPDAPGAAQPARTSRWRRSNSAVPTMQIITQNIDDLHERAGSHHVIRLHGRIRRTDARRTVRATRRRSISARSLGSRSGPPPCPHCGSPVRPDVVWFGEVLPADALDAATTPPSKPT